MTVAVEPRFVDYTPSGTTTGPFAVPFPFFEITVVLNGEIVDPTDYTIDQDEPGQDGDVYFTEPPSGTLRIKSTTEPKQDVDFISANTVDPESTERALDRSAMALQDFQRDLGTFGGDWETQTGKLLYVDEDGIFAGLPGIEGGGYAFVDEDGQVTVSPVVEDAPATIASVTAALAGMTYQIGDPVLSMSKVPRAGRIRLTGASQTFNKLDYPELANWLANLVDASGNPDPYPFGSTLTTFNLPSAAGYFLRFASANSSVDPDGPRAAGSTQTDQNKAHTHSFSGITSNDGAHTHSYTVPAGVGQSNPGSGNNTLGTSAGSTGSAGAHTHTFSGTTGSDGGTEARPKNIAWHLDVIASSTLSASMFGSFGFAYTFDSGTTPTGLTAGKVRLNHATLASVTAIYVHRTDGWDVDIGDLLDDLVPGNVVRLSRIGAQHSSITVRVSGTISTSGDVTTIPCTVRASGGSLAGATLALELPGPAGDVTDELAALAAGVRGTSTTSTAIGTGPKTFTTQAGKQWTAGQTLLFTSDAAPVTNYMLATVTSYAGTSLVVNVIDTGGSGTYADWTINLSGLRGPQGVPGNPSGVWVDVTASPYSASTGNTGAQNLAAIQAALDAVGAAGGGVVYIPSGVFVVAGVLQMYSNVELRGAGPGTVIRNPSGALTGKTISGISVFGSIAMTGVTGAAVRNLTVDHLTSGNTSNGIVIGGHGASVRSTKCVVEGVTVMGHPSHQYMIWIANADNNRVVGNTCYGGSSIPGTDTAGIEIHGGVGNVIDQNYCYYCAPGIAIVQEAAISGGDLIDNAITNNRIDLCGNGIDITNTNSRTLRNLLVSGNRISNCSNRGVNFGLSASGTAQNVFITGNEFFANPTHVAIDGNGATVTATDNVVISDNTMRSGASGVVLTYAPGVCVRGNRIRSTSGAGITMDRGNRAEIVGNTIDSPAGSGIEVYTTDLLTVMDNLLLDLAGLAIQSADSGNTNWLIVRNLFERAAGSSASNFVVAPTAANVVCLDNQVRNPPAVLYDLAAGGYSDVAINYSVPGAALNNVSLPAGRFVRFNGVPSGCELTGITGGTPGRILRVYNNTSGSTITLRAYNGGSSGANQLSLGTSGSIALTEYKTATFEYSNIDSKWMLVGIQ